MIGIGPTYAKASTDAKALVDESVGKSAEILSQTALPARTTGVVQSGGYPAAKAAVLGQ